MEKDWEESPESCGEGGVKDARESSIRMMIAIGKEEVTRTLKEIEFTVTVASVSLWCSNNAP
eukprot:CAMPEP_0201486834 /NCGR_PEP_ID=MMETSP0151_2-20130828/10880_1 /ASSEMBLY_ACC=CAM_ASM_000257 /TAXON_ID=200890 /ORGANISM="Paramoeba atlantica, Strain 621/1 / CCAP 1560/9" /LENGTH=61 /DNA_ID=CAMNT_0047871683 /DNA_START=357 /DNA_END=542 /DNA_ORIENTATION=+